VIDVVDQNQFLRPLIHEFNGGRVQRGADIPVNRWRYVAVEEDGDEVIFPALLVVIERLRAIEVEIRDPVRSDICAAPADIKADEPSLPVFSFARLKMTGA
jgi:hypothetical protein